MSNDDRLTKVLLAVIAVALCMIALNLWLRPVVVGAQSDHYLSSIDSHLKEIRNSVTDPHKYRSLAVLVRDIEKRMTRRSPF